MCGVSVYFTFSLDQGSSTRGPPASFVQPEKAISQNTMHYEYWSLSLNGTKSRVRIGRQFSDTFEIHNGVKQGAPLILQTFCHFTYVAAHSPTLPLLHLCHSSFSNPSFASLTSQIFTCITRRAAHARRPPSDRFPCSAGQQWMPSVTRRPWPPFAKLSNRNDQASSSFGSFCSTTIKASYGQHNHGTLAEIQVGGSRSHSVQSRPLPAITPFLVP